MAYFNVTVDLTLLKSEMNCTRISEVIKFVNDNFFLNLLVHFRRYQLFFKVITSFFLSTEERQIDRYEARSKDRLMQSVRERHKHRTRQGDTIYTKYEGHSINKFVLFF